MSKKQKTIWPAEPHTVAKLAILSGYLQAYFPILGTTRPRQEILIVDGFAGPDEYKNHPYGSPSAAIKTSVEALTSLGDAWKAECIHLAFIEEDQRRFAHLQSRVDEQRQTLPKRIIPHLYNTTFEKGLELIRRDVPQPFVSSHPLFVFIDPFGAKGAPFSIVAGLLESSCSEVLINFDADGIVRILRALSVPGNDAILNSIFGDESWRDVLNDPSFPSQCEKLRELYLARLRSLPNIKYVYSFAMHTTEKSVNYHLVFASQHHRGLEKMKVAMRKIGQDGSFKFSDDRHRSGQYSMFRFDDPDEYAPLMHARFMGQTMSYEEVRDFGLNSTPFEKPRICLAYLENLHLVEVKAKNPKRRRGTFDENDIISITFLPGIL